MPLKLAPRRARVKLVNGFSAKRLVRLEFDAGCQPLVVLGERHKIPATSGVYDAVRDAADLSRPEAISFDLECFAIHGSDLLIAAYDAKVLRGHYSPAGRTSVAADLLVRTATRRRTCPKRSRLRIAPSGILLG